MYQDLYDNAKKIVIKHACVKFYDVARPVYLETEESGISLAAGLLLLRDDMHVMGNILDLIFVEQVGNIKISNVKEDPMFSDHKSVECEIEIQKPEISKQSKTFRNWKM